MAGRGLANFGEAEDSDRFVEGLEQRYISCFYCFEEVLRLLLRGLLHLHQYLLSKIYPPHLYHKLK